MFSQARFYQDEPCSRAAPASKSALDSRLAFILSVGVLLIYSQGWVAPLFGVGADTADSGLIRAMFLPAYAASALLIGLAPWTSLQATARQPFLLLVLAIVAASSLWSIAPDVTARRGFAVICTTLGAAAIAARFRWARLAEVVAAAFVILALASLVVCIALPGIGKMTELFPGAWRGLWPEKNALGGNMALGFVALAAAAALNPRRAWLWGGGAALALFLVLMSTSKTSLLALLLGAGVLILVAAVRRGPAAAVAAVWLTVAGLVTVAGVMLLARDQVFGLLGKDATLTGRTEIWAAVMRRIQDRPWTGYGYAAVWGDKSGQGPLAWIAKEAHFTPQHAHNAWLEQWLGLGLPGLIAFSLFYAQTSVLALAAVFRSPGALLALPYLAVYSLMTLTESVAVLYNDMRWGLLVALAVKLAWPDAKVAGEP